MMSNRRASRSDIGSIDRRLTNRRSQRLLDVAVPRSRATRFDAAWLSFIR